MRTVGVCSRLVATRTQPWLALGPQAAPGGCHGGCRPMAYSPTKAATEGAGRQADGPLAGLLLQPPADLAHVVADQLPAASSWLPPAVRSLETSSTQNVTGQLFCSTRSVTSGSGLGPGRFGGSACLSQRCCQRHGQLLVCSMRSRWRKAASQPRSALRTATRHHSLTGGASR